MTVPYDVWLDGVHLKFADQIPSVIAYVFVVCDRCVVNLIWQVGWNDSLNSDERFGIQSPNSSL